MDASNPDGALSWRPHPRPDGIEEISTNVYDLGLRRYTLRPMTLERYIDAHEQGLIEDPDGLPTPAEVRAYLVHKTSPAGQHGFVRGPQQQRAQEVLERALIRTAGGDPGPEPDPPPMPASWAQKGTRTINPSLTRVTFRGRATREVEQAQQREELVIEGAEKLAVKINALSPADRDLLAFYISRTKGDGSGLAKARELGISQLTLNSRISRLLLLKLGVSRTKRRRKLLQDAWREAGRIVSDSVSGSEQATTAAAPETDPEPKTRPDLAPEPAPEPDPVPVPEPASTTTAVPEPEPATTTPAPESESKDVAIEEKESDPDPLAETKTQLHPKVRTMLENGVLTPAEARKLARYADDLQPGLAKQLIAGDVHSRDL